MPLRASLYLFILLRASFISTCSAAGIRSPPPWKELASASVGCNGALHGWLWDRCSLDDAVVWTAIAFGHHAISYMVFPPHAIGGHIQYSPFTADHPFIINFNENSDVDRKTFHLPPLVVSVYIQSKSQRPTYWNSTMTLRLTPIDDVERGKFDFSEIRIRAAFNCDCNDTVTYGEDMLMFRSNTEYTADNIIFLGPRGIFPEIMASAVYWVNVLAFMEPHALMPTDVPFPRPTDSSVLWSLDFAVANDDPKAQQKQPSQTRSYLKRLHAASVSHQMCEHAGHYGSHPSQHYDARMKVLSVWFYNGTQNMSMRIMSASVTHDRRGHADLELLVWFEAESSCNCLDLFLCNASPVSNLNLSCSIRGRSVQARLETQKYTMNGNQRENVVSCTFKSSAFSLSDDVVLVHIADPFAKLHAVVAFCPLPPARRIGRIVACSQPSYALLCTYHCLTFVLIICACTTPMLWRSAGPVCCKRGCCIMWAHFLPCMR